MTTLSCRIGRIGILAALLFSITSIGSAGDWPPSAVPLNHYQASWEKNPFNLKTASAGKSGGFANDLTLAGISKIGDGTTVLALNGKTGQYLRLSIGHKNADGIEVIEIRENANPREAEVVLRKGTSEAVLKFGDTSKTTPARRQTKTPAIRGNPETKGSRSQSSTKRPAEAEQTTTPSSGPKSSSGFRIPPTEGGEAPADPQPQNTSEEKSESSSAAYAEPLQYGTGKAAETRRRAMNSLPQAGAAKAP